MELGLLLSFLGASILLSLMPGPDNIFVLTESVTKGQRNGIAISIGLSCGVLIHTLAAATGLSIVIQQSAYVFSILKYMGAAYLFFMAYQAVREKNPVMELGLSSTKETDSFFSLVRKGFLMNVLNPKVALFFMAFLPQFISAGGIAVSLQMIILGFVFMLQVLLIFISIAILSSKLTSYVLQPRFWKLTKWSKISVLSILGLGIAFAKR